jgi:alginate O-acetyltransferase complex protein AlgI
MLLGGLWHGANWTFVAWGGYHGTLLILDRALETAAAKAAVGVRRAVTFVAIVVGWVLFRSTDFSMALVWLRKMVGLDPGDGAVPWQLIAWVLLSLVMANTLPETWDLRFGSGFRWAGVYAAGFVIAYLFMNGQRSVFLYYQF